MSSIEREYRANPALNQSTLKPYLSEDPAIALQQEKEGIKTTPSMRLGTCLHDILWKRGDASSYPVLDMAGYTSAKALKWLEENPDGVITKDFEIAKACANRIIDALPDQWKALYENPKSLLEVPFYKDGKKALLDVVSASNLIGMDWKTTSATSTREFMYDFYKYEYPLQAWWYKEVSGVEEFAFVVVSKTFPHPVWVLEVNEECLKFGEERAKEAMEIRNATLSVAKNESHLEATILEVGAPHYWKKNRK